MKNVLITGGGGFIGSHVAEFYANKKYINKIFVIDNLSRAKLLNKEEKFQKINWNYLKKYNKIELLKNDIRDFKYLKEFFKKNEIDIIIHTAAQTAVTTSVINPSADFENNVIGTFNLLESVRVSKQEPVMILCSTNKVFGNNVNKCDVVEKDLRYIFKDEQLRGIAEDFEIDLTEHTPYGTSKLCSDLYFQEYGQLYGLKTAVFRMSCIYGTRQFGVEDQGWVAHLVISAIKGQKINIYGDGKQVRDILFISDLINAYDSFIEKAEKIKHGVFCIGGGINNTLSLLELIEILKEKVNQNLKYEFFDWRPSDQKVFISDIQKANKILNWIPKVTPEEGVNKLITWVELNNKLFQRN